MTAKHVVTVFSLLCASTAGAQVMAPTPDTTEWRFNDAAPADGVDLEASFGPSQLIPTGMTQGVDWDMTTIDINGVTANAIQLTNVAGAGMGLMNWINAPTNGGMSGSDIGHYTYVLDLYVPIEGLGADYQGLWQGNAGNINDAEFFLDNSTHGFYDLCSGASAADSWSEGTAFRVIHTNDYLAGYEAIYVNGSLVHEGCSPDWLWGLGSGLNCWILTDDTVDAGNITCAAFALADAMISAEDAAALGSPSADGIFMPYSGPTDGACCLTDGTCASMSNFDCASSGGAFNGIGSDCADTECAQPPDNDECEGMIEVFNGANIWDSTDASNSADPPDDATCPYPFGGSYNDIWFTYTATASGTLELNTCDSASIDTDLTVYTGTCGNLSFLDCNGDASGMSGCQLYYSQLFLNVQEGDQLIIRIGGYGTGTAGPGTLDIGFDMPGACCLDGICWDDVPQADCDISGGSYQGDGSTCDDGTIKCGPPPNDECSGALAIEPGETSFDTSQATDSLEPAPSELECPYPYGDSRKDVWFSYTPEADGFMDLHTCDPVSYDTDLTVYTGTCTNLQLLACNGDGSGLPGCQIYYSRLEDIPVLAGETYTIRIGGYGEFSMGSGTLTLIYNGDLPEPPVNDECAGAIVLSEGINPFDSSEATTGSDPVPDPTECSGTGFGGVNNDIWFTYTPDADGTLEVHTCLDGSIDTDLVIYSGDCSALELVACNGDGTGLTGCQVYYSRISGLEVTAGTMLTIRLGGWATGDAGTGELTVDLEPSAPECPADIDGSGDVGFSDLLAVLSSWGATSGPEDIDGDGSVGFSDLLSVLSSWGAC